MYNIDINRFKSFIQQSEILLRSYSTVSKSSNEAATEIRSKEISAEIERFKLFVEDSIPLIIEPIKNEISLLKDHVSLIKNWHIHFDILDIANLTRFEDSYTKVIAWALNPPTHQQSILTIQKTWLNSLGINCDFDEPCQPMTFVPTTDGIIDILLKYKNSNVIIELKTDSREHTAPSGDDQTIAYAKAIKEKEPSKEVWVVFLTIDGHKAQNEEAKNTTYFHFACSLAEALRKVEISPDLKWAFSTVITHFINNLTPVKIDAKDLILKIDEWGKRLGDNSYLAKNINEIAPYLKLIEKGGYQHGQYS